MATAVPPELARLADELEADLRSLSVNHFIDRGAIEHDEQKALSMEWPWEMTGPRSLRMKDQLDEGKEAEALVSCGRTSLSDESREEVAESVLEDWLSYPGEGLASRKSPFPLDFVRDHLTDWGWIADFIR